MARGRIVSKSISTSKKFNVTLPKLVSRKFLEFPQALYLLIIPHTDDFGRMPADPDGLRLEVWPASFRQASDFAAALKALHGAELLTWYEVDGKKYLEITASDEHQTGLHKRTASRFPEIPGNSRKPLELPNATEDGFGKPSAGARAEVEVEVEGELEGEGEEKARPRGASSGKRRFLDFVFLTDDEHAKILEQLDGNADGYLERLNGYLGQSGRKYKSHYHTILNWWRKDLDAGKVRKPGAEPF